MNEFKRFEDRLTGLIESLSPSGRRRLSAELAKRLRQSQQRRVTEQEVAALELPDLVALAGKVVGFLSPNSVQ